MNLLIDGDGLVYRCGFAVEKTKYLVDTLWEDTNKNFYFDTHKEAKAFFEGDPTSQDIWSRKEIEPVENALALVKGALSAMPEGEAEIWLSPTVGNFRERIATRAKYKGNRDFAARPVHHKEITEYLISLGAQITLGQEADDELGIRQTIIGGDSTIVSFDKDLDQIPGMHYNWVTKELYEITPKEALLNFYTQILAGDRVDNVPGVSGIGLVTARRLLEGSGGPKEAWGRVLAAYEEKYGPRGSEFALETARLVWVRRKRDEIWEPPS